MSSWSQGDLEAVYVLVYRLQNDKNQPDEIRAEAQAALAWLDKFGIRPDGWAIHPSGGFGKRFPNVDRIIGGTPAPKIREDWKLAGVPATPADWERA